jgi:Druantia protein DruA
MDTLLSHRGRVVTGDDLAFIRELIATRPTASRRALSQQLCEAWNWRQANGALRDMVCRGLLLQLHRRGYIQLPPRRANPPNPLARRAVERHRSASVPLDPSPLGGTLSEIGPVTLHQVRRTEEEPLFNSLLAEYHYLGYTQPVGEHLKYLVYAQGLPIACLAWSSAPRHLGARDRFIGWSAEARRRNIHFLAYNTRFLILPCVQVPHLASHLLGRMARVLPSDWEQQYGHPVYFLETFIDPERFRGICYRAANWIVLGQTLGLGKDAPNKQPNRSIKAVLGYPLVKDFRRRLSEVG